MPIEIKELVIKANLKEKQQNEEVREGEESGSTLQSSADDKRLLKLKRTILEECQQMISDYFNRMNER